MQYDGPYVIRHGDLWFVSRTDLAGRRVCDGTQAIGVAYDAENGVLHKHGHLPRVQEWAAATRQKFLEAGFDDMAKGIVVIGFPVSEATVAELNACIAISGRVLQMEENLTRLVASHPKLADPPRYPC